MMNMNMKQYGMNDRFAALASMYEEEGLIVGRVISQEKDLYSIMTEHGERFAEVSGRFRYQVSAVSDYPAVGDFVMVDPGQYEGNAVIHMCCREKAVSCAVPPETPGRNRLLPPISILYFYVCR